MSSPLSLEVVDAPTAVDPVCGMTVPTANPPGGSFDHGGTTYHFCAERCRRRFRKVPGQYLNGRREGMTDPSADAVYVCPMCPQVRATQPGPCPTCGMALEPANAAADERPDPELQDMTQRMRVGIILGVPLMVLAMTDMIVPGMPIQTAIGPKAVLILQAVLAVPVVFWCGWPLLTRGWASIRNKSPNMFTLIAVGVLAATVYSFAALGYNLFGINPTAAVPGVSRDQAAQQISDATKADPQATAAGVRTGLDLLAGHHGMIEPFFESAAGIVVLVLIGQVMELRARRETGKAIRQLMKLTPDTARVVLADGRDEDLPLDLVDVGDRVRVKPGERVPVDGVIRDGTSAIDESALTGEPVRVEKTAGGVVMAGTSNGLGALVVEVTKASADSVLAHVVHLVGQAQRTRVPLQRTVDRIARWFVPLVLLAAVVTFAGWLTVGGFKTGGNWEEMVEKNWITYAVVCGVGVLIIACPCALGLATPMAVVAGVGRAARQGILFRDAAALEKLTQVTAVMIDKTGTLTAGKPRLTGVEPGVMEDPDKVLSLAAAVERGSEHPLGLAVVWEAVSRKLVIPTATNVRAVPGRGVVGVVNGQTVAVGNRQFLLENGVMRDLMPAAVAKHRLYGRGVMMVGAGEHCLGLIVVEDLVRPTAKEAVTLLRQAGLRVVLVSGDHADTANAVARAVGIEEVVADTLPAEKFAVVRRLQNEGLKVAMAGDGINDAPALAAADVGIAMGTGTDVAMNTAGVTLVKPDLRAITTARHLGAATVRTIRQNLWLAFGYNVLAIPVAAGLLVPLGGGLISPVWAAATMSLSSVSVILNSLRLGRMRVTT